MPVNTPPPSTTCDCSASNTLQGTIAADETDAVKFVLAGGKLWNSTLEHSIPGYRHWYAFEPGCDEMSSSGNYAQGMTPQEAVRNYIVQYGAPWEHPKDGL